MFLTSSQRVKNKAVRVYTYANGVKDKEVVNWVKYIQKFLILFLHFCEVKNYQKNQSKTFQLLSVNREWTVAS